MAVLLIIFAVFAVILLLPIRIKGGYGGGAWHVSAYYAFLRLFHKESPEKPPVLTPPKPDDEITEGQITALSEIEPVDSVSAQNTEPEPEHTPEEPIPDESAQLQTDTQNDSQETEPTPESESAEESDQTEESAAEEQPEKPKKQTYFRWLKPHSLHDILGLVGDGCAALSPGVRSLTKHLRFRHVNLRLNVGTDDPAKTAKTYGAVCGAFYNLHAQLSCVFDIEAESLRILADFEHDSFDFAGSMEIRVSPAALLAIVLVVGFKFLCVSYPRYRREKKEAALIAEETTPIPAE